MIHRFSLFLGWPVSYYFLYFPLKLAIFRGHRFPMTISMHFLTTMTKLWQIIHSLFSAICCILLFFMLILRISYSDRKLTRPRAILLTFILQFSTIYSFPAFMQ